MTAPTISMIAAISENYVIGDGEKMPWHIPEDLKSFRKITSGKPVIMGRKTFDSIGRALPKRDNIIVTQNKDWHPATPSDNIFTTFSLDSALTLAMEKAQSKQCDEIFIIGGATIYHQFLPRASRIYLTRIGKTFKGSSLFPKLEKDEWQLVKQEPFILEQTYDFDITFEQYERKNSAIIADQK